MRNVCSPGIGARPRVFMTWSFRTTEFRSVAWESMSIPSATVKMGF